MSTDRSRDDQPGNTGARGGRRVALLVAGVAVGTAAVLGTLDVAGAVDVRGLAAEVVAAPGPSRTPVPAGTSSAPAAGAPAVAPSGSPGPSAATAAKPKWVQPAPLVQPFARAPRSAPRRAGARKSGTPLPKGFDGCDHSYGKAQQCVPWSFPPGVTDRCGWLAAHGLKAFTVKTTDRHALDKNKDKIGCGTGD